MNVEHIESSVRSLNERIVVLEAEKVSEKYIRPLYSERQLLLSALIRARQDYTQQHD